MIAADYIAERLVAVGARHVFGVGGANIEDLFAAVQRRRPRIQAVLSKHEHAAGTAADAYARIGRGLGVVMVTSGGGAMNESPRRSRRQFQLNPTTMAGFACLS